MKKNIFLLNLLIGCFIFFCINVAQANPPSRVARLSYFNGQVSFLPASLKKWVLPTINRPLITGDRLWSDAGGKVELQLGRAVLRLGAKTDINILKLNDRRAQFKLDQGTVNLKIWNIKSNQAYEIDTPNIAFYVRKAGDYRIDVDRLSTTVSVRNGKAKVYGIWAVYATVNAQQSCRFTGTSLRGYRCFPLGLSDSFDRWCSERDRRPRVKVSIRYVSPEVVGYEDLDIYGTWRVVKGYGNVWMPNRVAPGWAPYRSGHWSWIEPWGWTWIDNEPWGFAPFHYGRWVNVDEIWYWVPGRMKAKPVYSPALVAFVGDNHLRSRSGAAVVAWFPLGPQEVYKPAYKVSRDYFVEVNSSNTTLNNTYIAQQYNQYTNITNVNNTNTTNVVYVNQSVPNAVSVVPAPVFTQSKPVSQAVIVVPQQSLAKEPVKTAPAVAPTQESIAAAPVVVVTPPPVVEQKKEPEKPIVASPESHAEKKIEVVEKPVVHHQPRESRWWHAAKKHEKPAENAIAEKQPAPEVKHPVEQPIEKPIVENKPAIPEVKHPVEQPAEKPIVENKPAPEVKHPAEQPVEKPIVEKQPAPEVKNPIEQPVEKPAAEHKPIPEPKLPIEKPAEIQKVPEKPIETEKAREREKPVEQPVIQAPPPPPPPSPIEEKIKPIEKQQEAKVENPPANFGPEAQKPKELKEEKKDKKEEPVKS